MARYKVNGCWLDPRQEQVFLCGNWGSYISKSSGIWRRVIWWIGSNVSAQIDASILKNYPEDDASRFLWNISIHLPNCMTSHSSAYYFYVILS
jgi:hypothetical protein